jgi:hypothetical protein
MSSVVLSCLVLYCDVVWCAVSSSLLMRNSHVRPGLAWPCSNFFHLVYHAIVSILVQVQKLQPSPNSFIRRQRFGQNSAGSSCRPLGMLLPGLVAACCIAASPLSCHALSPMSPMSLSAVNAVHRMSAIDANSMMIVDGDVTAEESRQVRKSVSQQGLIAITLLLPCSALFVDLYNLFVFSL